MRRLAVVLLVILALLGGGALAADRLLHARAESELLGTVAEQVALAPGAEVEIDGFPFLTQVAAGRLAEVRGRAEEASFDGVSLTDVRVAVRGVSPREPYRAETVEINADVPVETLTAVFRQELPVLERAIEIDTVPDGLLLSTEIAGVELAVGLQPVLDDGEIGFRLGELVVGRSASQEVLDVLDQALDRLRFEVPGLPDGLAVTRLAVTDEGVRFRLEGTDILFTTS